MLHTNRGELNQLYDIFCRVWAAGGQATLTTCSLGGKVTAKLELELGQPNAARPGAPPPHLRHVPTFASTSSAAPAPGAARRPCHRGPAAKAKARARAAAHQSVKAAASAVSAASRGASLLSPSTKALPSGGAPPSSTASAAPKHLPRAGAPPPASGCCLVTSQQERENSKTDADDNEDEDDNDYFCLPLNSPVRDTPSSLADLFRVN